ncbi:hypothetical protein [Amycolatopsis sp. cmx-11-51]|uniref:hypothetical protein n=1 Tax=unclassified Amycolatopsis TaxID=2618356 RepID=UPI0039E28E64
MQNWVKYILQTSLVGSGLLTLGTGIASAAENVNPDLPASPLDQIAAPAVSGLTDAMRQAQPLHQLATADQDSLRPTVHAAATEVPAAVPPIKTPAGPVYLIPADLLHSLPVQLSNVADEVREPDLHSPLGAELGAAELPALPVLSKVEPAEGPLPVRLPSTPVQSELAVLPVPVNGTVATDPLDADSGTRVTALTVAAPSMANAQDTPSPAATSGMYAVPGRTQRADNPLTALPLQGLLPIGQSILPANLGTGGLPLFGELVALTRNVPALNTGRSVTDTAKSSPVVGAPGLIAVQQVTRSANTMLRG